jgi:hypothetical protein
MDETRGNRTEPEREALRKMNRMLNRWMTGQLDGLEYEHGEGRTRNRQSYHYWESPDQRMFSYTPWKDSNGDYWTWVWKPYGRGSKSGKATKWKEVGKRVRSRKRKTARKRAQTRYENWMKYLAKNAERTREYREWVEAHGKED